MGVRNVMIEVTSEGGMMGKHRVNFSTNGHGYEEIRVHEIEDGERVRRWSLKHHRVLSWLWEELDSLNFKRNMREVHHKTDVEWLNTEDNLIALSPEQHREVDKGRRRIVASWELEEEPYMTEEIRRRCEPIHE